MFSKGKATAALGAAACAMAAGAVVAGVACIPDLPADQPLADADAPDAGHCGNGITELALGEQCDPGSPLPQDTSANGCNSDCTVSCLGGWVWSGPGGNNHCYVRASLRASSIGLQAEPYCQRNGGHLVTFASEEEFEAVVGGNEVVVQGQNAAFWVGLQPPPAVAPNPDGFISYAGYEPGWSPTCSGCFAHTDDASAPLPPGTLQFSCVEAFADVDASWREYPCYSSAPDAGRLDVVCEREPSGPSSYRCDGGICIDLPRTFGLKRYVYVEQGVTGDQAESHCASMGGTLVVLQTRDEREQLWLELSRMAAHTPSAIWIGLSEGDAGWVWDDEAGIDAYPSPWGDNAPSGNGARAQMELTSPPVDTTLADNDTQFDGSVNDTRNTFVCQILPEAGPPDAGDAGDSGGTEAGDGGAE